MSKTASVTNIILLNIHSHCGDSLGQEFPSHTVILAALICVLYIVKRFVSEAAASYIR
jgi:hypothetical protein